MLEETTLALAGSGKKFKKCCINKIEKNIVTPADSYIQKSLKNYPKEELKKYYDEDVISIDEKLYNALKHKSIPILVERNFCEEKRRDINNMEEAFKLIEEKSEKENITSVEDFDNKISIHYSLKYIIEGYLKILDRRGKDEKECLNKKIEFITKIFNIFKFEEDYKKDIISGIILNYLNEEKFYEAEKVIKEFKNAFPELETFLNSKLE